MRITDITIKSKRKKKENNKNPLTLQLLWNKKTKTTKNTNCYKVAMLTMAIRKVIYRKLYTLYKAERLIIN